MSMNSTPVADRVHIGFFGCRNAGKSSLVNAVTGQDIAVVSDVKGTTTDPVTKTMELLPLGPVVIIDTPGFDDEGMLGEKRVLKTKQILNKTDLAVLVVDGCTGLNDYDKMLLSLFEDKKIPYLIALNKSDLCTPAVTDERMVAVSAANGYNVHELKERLARIVPSASPRPLVSDLIPEGSLVVLVTPIDESAPRGRLILPQQQVIRDLLDHGNTAVVTKETELEKTLSRLSEPPAMVITDSQVFGYVAERVSTAVPLTSFSILMARHKGFLKTAMDGIKTIEHLKDGDTVLIAEGCTHHRQCNDIGSVKIPRWLKAYTGKDIHIKTCSGTEFPEDLSPYAVVIHCGGCMLTEREVQYRMRCAVDQGVPFVNYGTVIAHINGILHRSVQGIL